MLRKNIATIVTVMLAVLACAGAAGAQTLTGQLSGTVTDSSGGVLPGATVTLVNDLSNDSRTTVTNESGNFVFAAVPPGTYKVSVELAGFQKSEVTGIILRLGESRNITQIQLGVGGLSEQVAVTAITELAPVSSGEKSATITAEQIQNISIVGRSAAELLKILPGMAPITAAATARRGSTARSSASTATARAASRAPSATTRRTARRTTPSTSPSTARTRRTPAATARRP